MEWIFANEQRTTADVEALLAELPSVPVSFPADGSQDSPTAPNRAGLQAIAERTVGRLVLVSEGVLAALTDPAWRDLLAAIHPDPAVLTLLVRVDNKGNPLLPGTKSEPYPLEQLAADLKSARSSAHRVLQVVPVRHDHRPPPVLIDAQAAEPLDVRPLPSATATLLRDTLRRLDAMWEGPVYVPQTGHWVSVDPVLARIFCIPGRTQLPWQEVTASSGLPLVRQTRLGLLSSDIERQSDALSTGRMVVLKPQAGQLPELRRLQKLAVATRFRVMVMEELGLGWQQLLTEAVDLLHDPAFADVVPGEPIQLFTKTPQGPDIGLNAGMNRLRDRARAQLHYPEPGQQAILDRDSQGRDAIASVYTRTVAEPRLQYGTWLTTDNPTVRTFSDAAGRLHSAEQQLWDAPERVGFTTWLLYLSTAPRQMMGRLPAPAPEVADLLGEGAFVQLALLDGRPAAAFGADRAPGATEPASTRLRAVTPGQFLAGFMKVVKKWPKNWPVVLLTDALTGQLHQDLLAWAAEVERLGPLTVAVLRAGDSWETHARTSLPVARKADGTPSTWLLSSPAFGTDNDGHLIPLAANTISRVPHGLIIGPHDGTETRLALAPDLQGSTFRMIMSILPGKSKPTLDGQTVMVPQQAASITRRF
ncbi:hypothetical protein ACWGI8_41680, partial [Streptomyces sp. NPDC054841]